INIVGVANVQDDEASLLAYSYDSTPRFQALPDAVVTPRHTEDVKAIVNVCANYRVPIVPRGSGTNLCAGTTPLKGGNVLSFTTMNRIIEIDEKNLTITVQTGVYTKDIHDATGAVGLFDPPDPSSMHVSQIGGNISEISGGLRGLKYGVTRDYVLGLEVVFPNGVVINKGEKLAKVVTSYDMTRLLI